LRDIAVAPVEVRPQYHRARMPKPFYITTAIDYTNGAPHIGHAYEKVLADVIARYHRLKGEKVFFLTGVDQHGQKVQQSAEKAGVPPQQFVNEITAKFIALWEKLDVRYDAWAATTDPLHKKCVQGILQRLYDKESTRTSRKVTTASAGTVPDRQARTRWRVRPGMGAGRAPRGGELLFPAH
jgi:methionyl-tRNA synthetase